jgi:multiple sugar transport system permease protein
VKPFKGRARLFAYLGAIIACLLILFPFGWIFLLSLKHQIDIFMGNMVFTPTIENYSRVLFSKQSNFILNTRNSAVVAVVSTILVMIVGTLAAYSLSRHRWAPIIKNAMLGWTLIFYMIPAITLVGPWFLIFQRVGLYNTIPGLLLAHITLHLPMTMWLMMSYLQDVPKELEEAAWIDGCRRVQAFLKVTLPLAAPGLVAAGILAFVFSWNEFSVALNLTATQTATVPVGIARFAQQYEVRYGEMAAASVLSTIPAIVLMFVGQRFIMSGLTLGALK